MSAQRSPELTSRQFAKVGAVLGLPVGVIGSGLFVLHFQQFGPQETCRAAHFFADRVFVAASVVSIIAAAFFVIAKRGPDTRKILLRIACLFVIFTAPFVVLPFF